MYEENKELRSQVKEVAEILDLAECMEFDGQKYWIDEDNEKLVLIARFAMTEMES